MNVMTNISSVRARREAALRQANIAAGFPNLVDGQRLAATQTLDVIDPATGEILATVPDVDRRDLDAAVAAAAKAFSELEPDALGCAQGCGWPCDRGPWRACG